MINQPIQTIPILTNSIKINFKQFIIYRLFESWPVRIINGKLYRSMILFGYDPYINDHDKKRWRKYQHKIKYGFQVIDFNYDDLPIGWIKDENQPNDYLENGKIYGWIPVYSNTEYDSKDLKIITDQYYIEGFNWLCEKKLHILKQLKNTEKFVNCLDGYYNLLGRKIPGNSGSRENISQNYIMLNYDDTIIENIGLSYNDIIKWMEKNPKVFGFLFVNKYQKNNMYKLSRYNTPIKLNNKYDIYYKRKQYPLDGLI